MQQNVKRRIFNDPIYGFITIPSPLIGQLIDHPWFQRLRRIQQLGMTHLVYPGAMHTRFHHALGAMHLMGEAVEVIRSKGHGITEAEAQAVNAAILLHDIGHGPCSHGLEKSLVHGVRHEDLTGIFLDRLNEELSGELETAIRIFRNEYPKKFLHQLVSSQLDMDRIDYLRRDSFYTGVHEGVISSERIIKMLNVFNDGLVIDSKGIYSIEKFLIARRLMYWQVYLHKTAVAAEQLLVNILRRAKFLAEQGRKLFATPALLAFIEHRHDIASFRDKPEVLALFARLDDYDIMSSVKAWVTSDDPILSRLSENLVHRKLYKVIVRSTPFGKEIITEISKKAQKLLQLDDSETGYFVFSGEIVNNAYDPSDDKINILYRGERIMDIAQASDQLNITALSATVKKYFLCFPKECLPSSGHAIFNL